MVRHTTVAGDGQETHGENAHLFVSRVVNTASVLDRINAAVMQDTPAKPATKM